MDMEEDAEILATLLKHIPYCMSTADIEQECLDVHLLKPARLEVLPGEADVVCADDGQPAGPAWLEYPYCKSHPIIHWLPSKLAAWIGENYGQELQIPPKRGLEWTAGELNAILENNLVPSHSGKGQLQTFGCIQWECERYSVSATYEL
jgi:hypothetical protein